MGRSSHGKALGGEVGIAAIHKILSACFNVIFGIDIKHIIIHAHAIENVKAIGGISIAEGPESKHVVLRRNAGAPQERLRDEPFKQEHAPLIPFLFPFSPIVMIQTYMTELVDYRHNGWIVAA